MVHASDMRAALVPDENTSAFNTVGFASPVSVEPFYAGIAIFGLALDAWLPCFGTSKGGVVAQRIEMIYDG